MLFASRDTAQMTDREMEKHCDEYADILGRMADANHWDRALADTERNSATTAK